MDSPGRPSTALEPRVRPSLAWQVCLRHVTPRRGPPEAIEVPTRLVVLLWIDRLHQARIRCVRTHVRAAAPRRTSRGPCPVRGDGPTRGWCSTPESARAG